MFSGTERKTAPHPAQKQNETEETIMGTYYITTPIYYPSDKLHIGHAYCTVATDAFARYHRMRGDDVMFLTGTDEHGQKIEDKARAAGKTPRQFVDEIVAGPRGILDLWKLMNISNDRFIRTTDDYHVAAVQRIFKKMYDKGDIYKGKYSGMYCTPCESFWTESQLKDGKCPDCGGEVRYAEEEAYFFRLSKYAEPVRSLLLSGTFLEPASRVNEMIHNFIDCEGGLQDLCVSRTTFSWGIPVDFDPGHVVYVWVDALSNYITALGYENSAHNDYDRFWPADVHIVGKEIVRFHSIIWPAMLMSLGLPLPKKVYGHGWLVMDGGKMSKSRGNVVDPYLLAERYGVDALRFFLLRTFPFGSDGNFSNELLISTINTDLANDLGNLVSRTVAMVEKYFGGTLPAGRESDPADTDLLSRCTALRDVYAAHMDAYAPQKALDEVFKVISRANKYIDENAPWVLAKDPQKADRLAAVLYNLLEAIRITAALLGPITPESSVRALEQIGCPTELAAWDRLSTFGVLPAEVRVCRGPALFPRIDMAKELDYLNTRVGQTGAAEAAEKTAQGEPAAQPAGEPADEAAITIDDFSRVALTVVRVLSCERVEKSKKLLRFLLDDGSGTPRQILSGIAKWYTPEELVGKTLVACTNLAARKMMGQDSCGMLLSAVHEEAGREVLNLIMLDSSIPAGARLC